MNDDIQNIQLRFSCPENWENMTPAENGRHCDKCNKTVHDFTNSKVEEFRAIMAENNNSVCGRFSIDQMAVVPVVLPLWKRWLSAALVLVGINLFACKSNSSQTLTGDTVMLPPASQNTSEINKHICHDTNQIIKKLKN